MIGLRFTTRLAAAAAGVLALAACSQVGSLGSILGSVLGGGNELSGTVQYVDTRNQQLTLQESGGQNVALQYDANTRVLYQNRAYSVTSLDPGDQVNAYIQQLQGGAYYADSVVVVQPASGTSTGTSSGNVQSLQGSVRSIDRNNGLFTVDVGNGTVLTVTLPYNASSTDVNKFNALRTGDYTRFYGVYVTNTRVELRNFY